MVLEKVIDPEKQRIIKQEFLKMVEVLEKIGCVKDLSGYQKPIDNSDIYEYLYKVKTFFTIVENYKESRYKEHFMLVVSDSSQLLTEKQKTNIEDEKLPILIKGLFVCLAEQGFKNCSYYYLTECPYTKEMYNKYIYQFEKVVNIDGYEVYIDIIF